MVSFPSRSSTLPIGLYSWPPFFLNDILMRFLPPDCTRGVYKGRLFWEWSCHSSSLIELCSIWEWRLKAKVIAWRVPCSTSLLLWKFLFFTCFTQSWLARLTVYVKGKVITSWIPVDCSFISMFQCKQSLSLEDTTVVSTPEEKLGFNDSLVWTIMAWVNLLSQIFNLLLSPIIWVLFSIRLKILKSYLSSRIYGPL